MAPRQCNMAAMYLILALILGCVTLTQQQHVPSPAEQQAILLLHNLIKANPNIKGLIQAAESLPDNASSTGPLQGVTLSPILSMAMGALQSLQSPFTAQTNSTTNNATNAATGNAQNVTSTGMASLIQLMMQNPAYRDVIMEVVGEVQGGLQKARIDGVDVTSNFTALLSYINPVSLLRKAAVPLLSASQFPDQTELVNPECYRDVIDTATALLDGEGWAIEMLDALGKPNAGIERGAFYFVGAYDECVNIKPHVVKQGPIVSTARDFGTRHCRVDITIPETLTDALNVDTHGIHLKLIWGLCVPNTCHEHDVRGLFKLGFLNQTNIPIEDVKCHRDLDIGSDNAAIAAITIFSFFGFLVFAGTLVDGCRACAVNSDAGSKAETSAQTRPSSPPVKAQSTNGNTNGIAVIDTKDGTLNGDATTKQPVITADEVSLELPPGYVPHKEGPHLPLYVSKPPPDPVTPGQGSNGTAGKVGNHGTSRTTTPARRDSVLVRTLLCFSVYTNIPKILGAKSAPGSISCVHGIRLLSIMWVILGHTYNYGLISDQGTFTADNLVDFEPIYQRFTYQAVMAGGYAVDTFFMLSGFLLTWIQLKEADKRKQKLDVRTGIMYYFHRFWRLTPIYMFVLMGYTCLWRYLGSGPFWPNNIKAADVCRDSWWTNLLYVNNLVKSDEQCMGWSWYLANDMQFYVISPIFIIAMYFSPTLGALLTSALLAMGVAISFWKEHIYNGGFMTMMADGGDYWRNVYTVPWCRVSCWAVGMLLGMVIYKRGQKALRNKKLYGLGWLLAWGVALFLVYITHTKHKKDGTPWTPVESAFHESFGRAAWAACVAWVIFACYTGKGGVVNSLLSWNGLIPLSRLSYAAYLVHPICMQVYIFSRRALFHVDDYNTIYLFLGHSCVTFMVAFVFSLVFEAPFMALEKVLLPQPRRK